MKRTLKYVALALVFAGTPAAMAEGSDCYDLSVAVTKAVSSAPSNVLEIVQLQVAASPECACEVVKAAIVATEADRKLVGQIVATAIEAAPDKMRIVAQCAIAVAPDALPNVQAILAKLDPQGGDGYSDKGGMEKGGMGKGKGGEVEVAPRWPSVLDGPYLVPGEPPIHPFFISPPSVSDPGHLPHGSSGGGSGGDGGVVEPHI